MTSIYRAPDTLCSKPRGHEGPHGTGNAVMICGERLFGPKTDPKNGHAHGRQLDLCYIVHEEPR